MSGLPARREEAHSAKSMLEDAQRSHYPQSADYYPQSPPFQECPAPQHGPVLDGWRMTKTKAIVAPVSWFLVAMVVPGSEHLDGVLVVGKGANGLDCIGY